ncbi:MAG: hypothetical protein AAF264_01640 [Pseudomonadota bacterium]
MRFFLLCVFLCGLAVTGSAEQKATVAAPTHGFARYDPTLSAKEAVLANWDLAASGIRAGAVVGARVIETAERDVPYARLARVAAQAEKTMVQRWNAAQWIYAGEPDLSPMDGEILRDVVTATATPCPAEPCTEEKANLRAAFTAATERMGAVAVETRAAVEARMVEQDAALMSEQLAVVAQYLAGGDWATDLSLADAGRDREEVAARLVGAMALWRNIEPYVGLTSPEIDAAVNVAVEELLRTLRLGARQDGPLTADGPELTALRARAEALAAEFRRAAGLFAT